ncbi:MAG TPA: hypothetical protein VFQ51_04915 [Vicinamibacteria bacterium]|nr:hypothetical protein [Vicinamibacteria bacterium]
MARPARDPREDTARLVKRILLLLALGVVVVVVGLVTLVGASYYRMYRHGADFDASIREVDAEDKERERFQADARARLLAGDFERLDALARELRASGEAFRNGAWKLNVLYLGLSGPADSEEWSEPEWAQAISQAQRWARERPDSIAARLVAADLWISYAWTARERGGAHQTTDGQDGLFRRRVDEATSLMADAQFVAERCPRRADRLLALALAGTLEKEDELAAFRQGIQEYPDWQPLFNLHLLYLQPGWFGEPGEAQRAATAIAQGPGGPEKVARAAWYLHRNGAFGSGLAPWPTVKKGFADMRAHHPDSLEVSSASCFFAAYYKDRGATASLLKQLDGRMVPSVWTDRKLFVDVYGWATWEERERAGGDPLARAFGWLLGR